MKIKCVCGYESDPGFNVGDEEFVALIGRFEVSSQDTGATCAFAFSERIELLACPKCGTVRMERRHRTG